MRRSRGLRTLYWTLVAIQWLLLTLTLASGVIRSVDAFGDYVSPGLPDGSFLVLAFLLAFLLGLSIRSLAVLVVLAIAMSLVGAVIYGAVIYLPAWQGILFRSVTLANYAQQQALIMFLLTLFPSLAGAVASHLLGGPVQRQIDILLTGRDDRIEPWWERVGKKE